MSTIGIEQHRNALAWRDRIVLVWAKLVDVDGAHQCSMSTNMSHRACGVWQQVNHLFFGIGVHVTTRFGVVCWAMWEEDECKNLRVGDIIKVEQDETAPVS